VQPYEWSLFDDTNRNVAYSPSCNASTFQPIGNDCYPCTRIPRHKWLSYYVFSAVRNPISRALSSYLYCGKQSSGMPFNEWCRNPYAGGGTCGVQDMADMHLAAQSPWLCNRMGSCIVDYVAHVENINAEMDIIVSQINRGRQSASMPALPPFSSSVLLNARNAVSSVEAQQMLDADENKHCANDLRTWFKEDLDILGY
jgi:hypothetical protein